MRFAYLIPPMMLLAACGQSGEKGDSSEVTVHADGESGKLKIGGDGVNIDLDIPDIADLNIDSDFDIDGVKLYPGSQITTMDINADSRDGASDAVIKFGFTAPAAPKVAADWMAGEFAKKSVKITRTGDTLAGKGKDGEDFTISFGPDGATSKGEVRITKG